MTFKTDLNSFYFKKNFKWIKKNKIKFYQSKVEFEIFSKPLRV